MNKRFKGLLAIVLVVAVCIASALAASATYSEYKYNVKNYSYTLSAGSLVTTASGSATSVQTVAANNANGGYTVASLTYSVNRNDPSKSYNSGMVYKTGGIGAAAVTRGSRVYNSHNISYYHKGFYYHTSNMNYVNDTTLTDTTFYTASQ